MFTATSIAVGQEPPAGLECGTTITADTTLDRDLSDCPSNGILIGADDITLDLNGHTISGDGKPVKRCPRDLPCDLGVFTDRYDGVTVRNGSVRGFGIGVFAGGGRGCRLVELSSSRNQYFGFVIANSSRTVIRDSSGNGNPGRTATGWECSPHTTCGSWATRSATTASACTSRARRGTSSRETFSFATATSASSWKPTALRCEGIASPATVWRPSSSVPAAGT